MPAMPRLVAPLRAVLLATRLLGQALGRVHAARGYATIDDFGQVSPPG